MKRHLRLLGVAIAIIAATASPAWADCRDAIDSYNRSIADIEHLLGRYARCVSGSMGNDDCSSEFRRLRSAQSDYEYAVSEYRSECD